MLRLKSTILISLLVIVISPMATAIIAGLRTSLHRTGRPYYDGSTPSIEDARGLLRAYQEDKPAALIDDKPFYEKAFASNSCGGKMPSWRHQGDGIEMTRSFSYAADRIQESVISEYLQYNTTAFGRGFYRSCLLGIYAPVCRPHVDRLLETSLKPARPVVLEAWTTLYDAAQRLNCADFPASTKR